LKQISFITSCTAVALVLAMPVHAQTVDPAAKAEELKTLQENVEQSAVKQEALEAEIAAQVAEQEVLSKKLVAVAADMRGAEERAAVAIEKQKGLQKEKADLGLALALQQDELSGILAGLQSLERDPPPALVASPGDVLDALRGAMLFGTVVPELRDKALQLRGRLEALVAIDQKLSDEATAEREALASLSASRRELSQVLDDRKKSLKQSESILAQEQDRARAVAAKAQSTRELIMKLLAAREIAAVAERKAEDERLALARAEEERLRKLAELPMSQAIGKLGLPVAGSIIMPFGADTGLGQGSYLGLDGIVIATAPQSVVTSPVRGRIEFAGPFRSYGTMVIVNAGEGFLVLLSGLAEAQVQAGQDVLAGEPVGVTADLATSTAQAAAVAKDLTRDGKPVLYVEFRKNGDPVDPAPWWDNPRQEALR
jgi:murein hydrolase activator